MNCCYKKDFKNLLPYTIIFDIDILYDRTFYTNNYHSGGNFNTSIFFKKNTSINNIYNILLDLLKNSKKKLDINDAKYLILPKTPFIEIVNIELLNKIKKIFPKLKIIKQNVDLIPCIKS